MNVDIDYNNVLPLIVYNIEFFPCDKLKDIFNIYIYVLACVSKLGNQSGVHL